VVTLPRAFLAPLGQEIAGRGDPNREQLAISASAACSEPSPIRPRRNLLDDGPPIGIDGTNFHF
jgi:hypothetical protein